MNRLAFYVFILCFAICARQANGQNNCDSTKNINMKIEKIETIIVFKKNVEINIAESLLDSLKVKHRYGMDSSKGKGYFYKTGPKFIVTFKTLNEKQKFILDCQKVIEIFEIYTPNWEIIKD